MYSSFKTDSTSDSICLPSSCCSSFSEEPFAIVSSVVSLLSVIVELKVGVADQFTISVKMTTLIRGSMSACMRSTTRSSRSINSYRNCSLAYMRPGVRTFSLSTRLYRNATFRMEAEASAPRLQTTPLVFLSPPGRDARYLKISILLYLLIL